MLREQLKRFGSDISNANVSAAAAAAHPSESSDRPQLTRRAQTAPAKAITGRKSKHPDWILVFCYMLVYLELGWLVTFLWRSYGKPI